MTSARTLMLFALAGLAAAPALAQDAVLTGAAAFGDWRDDQPGITRRIGPNDLPDPKQGLLPTANNAQVALRPGEALPKVPNGFQVTAFAKLEQPRKLLTAPNGDVFVAESYRNQITVLRAAPGAAKAQTVATFASQGLNRPYGLALYPAKDPQWLYVGNTDSVVRFPYRAGDLKARGPAQTVIADLVKSGGGHWTRDIAFSPDGKRLLVAVGSQSNVAEKMPDKPAGTTIADWQAAHGLGAAWGEEEGRAQVRTYTVEGKDGRAFANGIRNCAGLTVHPTTGELWCTTNERDRLGDNLAPDYATRVRVGGFYGWPWYYIGSHPDPRHSGSPRRELAGRVNTPDVLFQAHSASLQTIFYPQDPDGPAAFPAAWRGQGFTALHGSWNRSSRTGYKVVRLVMKNGAPTGEYQDFMTGFVLNPDEVWGRPVGLTVAADGALLVSEDANGMVWRIAPTGK